MPLEWVLDRIEKNSVANEHACKGYGCAGTNLYIFLVPAARQEEDRAVLVLKANFKQCDMCTVRFCPYSLLTTEPFRKIASIISELLSPFSSRSHAEPRHIIARS